MNESVSSWSLFRTEATNTHSVLCILWIPSHFFQKKTNILNAIHHIHFDSYNRAVSLQVWLICGFPLCWLFLTIDDEPLTQIHHSSYKWFSFLANVACNLSFSSLRYVLAWKNLSSRGENTIQRRGERKSRGEFCANSLISWTWRTNACPNPPAIKRLR